MTTLSARATRHVRPIATVLVAVATIAAMLPSLGVVAPTPASAASSASGASTDGSSTPPLSTPEPSSPETPAPSTPEPSSPETSTPATPTGSLTVECRDDAAVLDHSVVNDSTSASWDVELVLDGEVLDSVVAGPGTTTGQVVVTDGTTGTASLLVDGTEVATVEVVACSQPEDEVVAPTVEVRVACPSSDGEVATVITNEDDQSIEVGVTVADEAWDVTVAPGETEVVVVGGLPDGDHDVVVSLDGETVYAETVTVDCVEDPAPVEPSWSITDTCTETTGVITASVTNPTDEAITVTLSVDGADAAPTTWEVPAGDTVEGQVGDLADGTVTATLELDGEVVETTDEVTIDCAEDATQPQDPSGVIVSAGCVGQDGRVTAEVTSPGDEDVTATLRVVDTDFVVEQDVAAGTSATIDLPGLPDGTWTVELVAGGTVLATASTVIVECDVTGAIVTVSCVETDGVAEATVTNPGPEDVTATLRVVDTDFVVEQVVAPATVETLELGGLPDGTWTVELLVGDTVLDTLEDVVIECDEPTADVEIDKTNDADTDESFTDVEVATGAGQDVDFLLEVTNTGQVAGTVRLHDELDDGSVLLLLGADAAPEVDTVCVDGEGNGFTGTDVLEPGATIACTFTLSEYSPDALAERVNTARVDLVGDGSDGPEVLATDSDDSTVRTQEVLGEGAAPSLTAGTQGECVAGGPQLRYQVDGGTVEDGMPMAMSWVRRDDGGPAVVVAGQQVVLGDGTPLRGTVELVDELSDPSGTVSFPVSMLPWTADAESLALFVTTDGEPSSAFVQADAEAVGSTLQVVAAADCDEDDPDVLEVTTTPDDSDEPGLADTGVPTFGLVGLGALLVALGGLLVARGRRREVPTA